MAKRELTEEERALRARLGAAIRVASGRKGLRPTDLATVAGVALSQQYRIENGELTADILYLVKVAALLGTSIDALLEQAQADLVLKPAAPSLKVSSKHGHAAGRDVNVTTEVAAHEAKRSFEPRRTRGRA